MDFTYLKFLRTLLGFKDKLPAVFAQIQILVATVKAIVAIVSPDEPAAGELAMTADAELSGEELLAEGEIANLMAGETGMFDGSLLRKLFSLKSSNPELWALVVGLLSKFAGI